MKKISMGLLSILLTVANASNIQFTIQRESAQQNLDQGDDVNHQASINEKFYGFKRALLPIVINTWPFISATEKGSKSQVLQINVSHPDQFVKAWEVLTNNGTPLDAVEQGCTVCEQEQCDGTVGYGGSPNENGETTLDAMIMDGSTHKSGAVAGLCRVKQAISVARKVLEHTDHTLIVGEWATNFALEMGFKEEPLETVDSYKIWREWKDKACQPNFWRNVEPNPRKSCGPYSPLADQPDPKEKIAKDRPSGHDTIGMVVIDSNGNMACGTSTNGARHKIPGRVGDAPITGSGSYVDQEVGGAAATGDGDVLMRFLPSFAAVEYMRNGMTPSTAAGYSLKRIADFYPNFQGAVVAVKANGEFGAACQGFPKFSYTVVNPDLETPQVFTVECSV